MKALATRECRVRKGNSEEHISMARRKLGKEECTCVGGAVGILGVTSETQGTQEGLK